MIMEFIQIDHIAPDMQRARAISDIVSIDVPIDAPPGPVGGERLHMRMFWEEGVSDVAYSFVQDLKGHFNRVHIPKF